MPRIEFREAEISDLHLLRRWDRQPHVIDADPNDDWEWEIELLRRPDWREQLIAELDGRPIGFVQIIDPAREESRYWGDIESGYRAIDIWIGLKSDLGKGYGTIMMKSAIERCFMDKDIKAIIIDPLASNKDAHRFYNRFGFRFVEERWFGKDHCFVFKLDRENYHHMIRS
jgi:aminoglycoside 6'-N-acetyltransferase